MKSSGMDLDRLAIYAGRNGGAGIHRSDTSVAEFGGSTSQITGNGYGISCDGSPSVAVIRGDPGNVSVNTSGKINCQNAGG